MSEVLLLLIAITGWLCFGVSVYRNHLDREELLLKFAVRDQKIKDSIVDYVVHLAKSPRELDLLQMGQTEIKLPRLEE
jgi:hypothetical protein